MIYRFYLLVSVAVLPVLAQMVLAPVALAEEIIVNTIFDDDADTRCSLRDAITAANADMANDCTAGNGPDTILLDFDFPIKIEIAGNVEDQNMTGDFDIRSDITIRPLNENDTILIDAQSLDRHFEVFDGANLTLERLRLINGFPNGFGGAIFVQQEASLVRIRDSEIAHNEALLFGGAIHSEGSLFIDDSTIHSNISVFGGGIYMGSFRQCNLTRATVRDNIASQDGGGLHVLKVVALDSSIHGNTAGRDGGGVAVPPNGGLSLLTNTTIAGNSAVENGGGFFLDTGSSLELLNATIAWNTADSDADGIGDGGGLFADGLVRPSNSILAANLDFSVGAVNVPDCAGEIDSREYNLFGSIDTSVCVITGQTTGDLAGSLASPLDAGLDTLAANGGPTLSVALLDGSAAIDSGNPDGCRRAGGIQVADQRGHLRPWDGPDADTEARCDRGSIEFGAPGPGFLFGDDFETGDTSAWNM